MRGQKNSIHLIVVISDSEGAFERSSDYSFIFQQWLLFTCSANPKIRNPIPSNIWLEMVSDCCQRGIHLLHLCSFWNLLICCLYAFEIGFIFSSTVFHLLLLLSWSLLPKLLSHSFFCWHLNAEIFLNALIWNQLNIQWAAGGNVSIPSVSNVPSVNTVIRLSANLWFTICILAEGPWPYAGPTFCGPNMQ